MSKKIIITTTNLIEGAKIEKYLGVINTNIVIGTNVFSDIGASVSDFFGGEHDSYQNKLENMYKKAVNNLKLKLRDLGGNAIIGLSSNFDEISGKGKAMFMVSVSGTAVKISIPKRIAENKTSEEIISLTAFHHELKKELIIADINNQQLLSQEQWDFLINEPIEELSKNLLYNFINVYNTTVEENSDEGKTLFINTIRYFGVLDKTVSKEILYSNLIEESILTTEIINQNKLFDADFILKLIEKGQITLSVNCLKIDKQFYTVHDLELMNKIIISLEDKGLEKNQIEKIDSFKHKVNILNSMLTNNI